MMLRRRMMMNALGGSEEIEVPNGVYIQDTNGVLWTKAAWDGSATPNGIAVVADECRFVIALSEASGIPIDKDGYSDKMNLTAYSSSREAIKDYSGSSNTTAMISAYGDDTAEAAGYCRNFTFPNGKAGYLGSAGEWQVAYDNKSGIATCMSKVGGTDISDDNYYWTSTLRTKKSSSGSNAFWRLYWSSGGWNSTVAESAVRDARPFGVLDIKGVRGKQENKITIVRDTLEPPNGNIGTVTYLQSQYPVASDIQVTVGVSSFSQTATISEGKTKSKSLGGLIGSILYVTPAEDDTYIYTF